MVQLHIDIEEEDHAALVRNRERNGQSIRYVVTCAIREWLDRNAPDKRTEKKKP